MERGDDLRYLKGDIFMKRKTWVSMLLALVLVLACVQMASAASYDAVITVPPTVTDAAMTVKAVKNLSSTKTAYVGTTTIDGCVLSTSYTKDITNSKNDTRSGYVLDVSNVIGLGTAGTAEIYYDKNGKYTGYKIYRGNLAMENIPVKVNVLFAADTVSVSDPLTAAEVNTALSKMTGPSGYYYGGTYGDPYDPYAVGVSYIPGSPDSRPESATSSGWHASLNGKWYAYPDGSYVANQWKKIDGKWYYFDARGYMVTNRWVGNYYLTATGEMAVSTWIDGKYYVDATGAWVPTGKATASVSAATGWQKDANGWWYRYSDGSYAKSGWRWIDGNGDGLSECYYFNALGYLVTNTSVDGSTVNGDGAWTVNGVVQHRTH